MLSMRPSKIFLNKLLTFDRKRGIFIKSLKTEYARVAELADALDSGSSEGNFMGVQVPPLAPNDR